MLASPSGLGHLSFKQKGAGSNPAVSTERQKWSDAQNKPKTHSAPICKRPVEGQPLTVYVVRLNAESHRQFA